MSPSFRKEKKKWTPFGRPRSAGGTEAPTARRPSGRLSLLHHLAMQGVVEAVALDLVGDAQADRRLEDREDDEADDAVVDDHGDDADRLVHDLARVALDETRGAAVLLDREYAGQQRADDAADAVDAEAVERVVVAEGVLERSRAEVAADAGGDADDEPANRADEAGGWRDRHTSSDGA